MYEEFPAFQLAIVEGDDLLAEAHALPVQWDGTLEDLPAGWDAVVERGMTSDREPTVLCALAISVSPERQGGRLSSRMIRALTETARAAGLSSLIAPVRPTYKTALSAHSDRALCRVAA